MNDYAARLAEARVAAISAREAATTRGPWETRMEEGQRAIWAPDSDWKVVGAFTGVYSGPSDGEATFITHARDDIPWLLERLAKTERALADATSALESVPGYTTTGTFRSAVQIFIAERDEPALDRIESQPVALPAPVTAPPKDDRRAAIRVVLRNHGVLAGVRDEWADELIRKLAVATDHPMKEATL